VGNPPFLGGLTVRRQIGEDYLRYLRTAWPHTSGTVDLAAYFYLRAFAGLAAGGTFGLIATNTISQGDTREGGLDYLVGNGASIYAAVPRMPWPGEASVNISLVHVGKGQWEGTLMLGDKTVSAISTLLDASGQTSPPERLLANDGLSFIGSFILGLGFTMSPEEAQEWIRRNPRNAEVLFPYINGEDLNTSPTQEGSRWVINFRDWPLEKAAEWPVLLDIVREKVKPERDKVNRAVRRKRWWRFAEYAPNLYRTIAPLRRVLVRTIVTRTHALAFVEPLSVFSHKVVVFPADDWPRYAVLQSSLHEHWVWRYTSTMRTDPNYAPSDCFETFPFPRPDDTVRSRLDDIGEAYHEHRREIMLANQEGLTKTYNRFHDPECNDSGIVRLRELHVEMDLAVRDAYGWSDLSAPLDLGHGWVKSVTVEEKKNRKTAKVEKVEKIDWRYTISPEAKDEVLRRLLALNHERYEEEREAAVSSEQPVLRSLGEVGWAVGPKAPGEEVGEEGTVERGAETGKRAGRKPLKLTPHTEDPKKGPRLL